MTAAGLPGQACPSCGSVYVTDMEDGTRFCAECRHEWDPTAPQSPAMAAQDVTIENGAPVTETPGELPDVPFTSIVEVSWQETPDSAVRTDRYTYVTAAPHPPGEAMSAADANFKERGGQVLATVVTQQIPIDAAPWEVDDLADDPISQEHPDFTDDAALAEAYLETLLGSTVILEGGQSATLLEFLDDDQVRVQLGDGRVEVVDLSDVERQVIEDTADPTVELDIPDDVAKLVGDAAVTMALLVLEAGVRSVSGAGDDQTIAVPPTGWFPPDADAIPLMEQASAAAIAMLIISFRMPVDRISEMVDGMRAAMSEGDQTEET